MKPLIKFTTEFNPNFTHKFFIDSNIWFYLLFPQYSKVSAKIISLYSDLFNQILTKKCLIETTILQISELVNLIQRTEFKQYSINNPTISYKNYIKLEEGKKSLLNAQILVNTIIRTATIRQGNLNEEELKQILNEIEKADFNDICIARHCEKEKAILITHDFDFNAIKMNLEIITANEKYLKM